MGERGGVASRAGRGSRRPPCLGPDLPPWVVPIPLPTPYPIGPVTVYLLRSDPITLIDTGPATRAAWTALRAALAAQRLTTGDVRRVLVTHGHHDHFGLGRRLASVGATIHAHPDDGHNLRLERRYRRLWRELRKAGLGRRERVSLVGGVWALDLTTRSLNTFVPLTDGTRLAHGEGEILVHHLPGHSPGHVAFELVDEGLIVSGDTLLEGITPNAVVDLDPAAPEQPFLSLAAYRRSLDRLDRLAPVRLLTAHGPCISDVPRRTAWLRARQEERREQVLTLLDEPGATTAELIDRLFPGIRVIGLFLAYSEVFGHLLDLERRGLVVAVSVAGVERWVRRTAA